MRPKSVTFRAGTLGRWMQRHGVELKWRRAIPFKEYDPGARGHYFLVSVARRGATMEGVFPKEDADDPTPDEVFGGLGAYIVPYEAAGHDPAAWTKRLGLRPRDFERAAQTADNLRHLLGERAYRELVEIAQSPIPEEPAAEEGFF